MIIGPPASIRRVKMVIQADTNHIIRRFCCVSQSTSADTCRDRDCEIAVGVLQIKVFDFSAPAPRKHPFDTSSRYPSKAVMREVRQACACAAQGATEIVLAICPVRSAGAVKQHILIGNTGAAAYCAEPIDFCSFRDRTCQAAGVSRCLVLIGGLNVTLNADEKIPSLPIVSGLKSAVHAIEVSSVATKRSIRKCIPR